MLNINKYGESLMESFHDKSNMENDVYNGTFQGTIDYEKYIDTLEDLLGWLLITYDVSALDVIYEWESMQLMDNVYGFKYEDIIKELKKIIRNEVN